MHQDDVRLLTHSIIPPVLGRTRSSRPIAKAAQPRLPVLVRAVEGLAGPRRRVRARSSRNHKPGEVAVKTSAVFSSALPQLWHRRVITEPAFALRLRKGRGEDAAERG